MTMTVIQGWVEIALLVPILLLLWDIGSRLRDIRVDASQARDSLVAIQDEARRQR